MPGVQWLSVYSSDFHSLFSRVTLAAGFLKQRLFWERWRTQWNRRGLNNGSRRRAIQEKAVEQAVKLIDGRNKRLHDKTVLTGDAMAFNDLRDLLCQFGNPWKLP